MDIDDLLITDSVIIVCVWITALMVIIAGAMGLARALSPWRYDERNPARRFCKECGQQQDLYGHNWETGFEPTGWEYMGRLNTECSHKHRI